MVNIQIVPSHIKPSAPAGLQAITAAELQHLRVPSARYVNAFLPKHHTTLYCRQSLFMKAPKFTINTLWSIYCYAGNVLWWPSSCSASRDWHAALKSSTFGSKDFNEREKKSQRRSEAWREKRRKSSLHHRTALTEISARSHQVNHHLDHEQDLSERMKIKWMKGRREIWLE